MLLYYLVSLMTVCLCTVSTYTLEDLSLYPEDADTLFDSDFFTELKSYLFAAPVPYIPAVYDEQTAVSKRRSPSRPSRKRATLNQLLERLISLYGHRDIPFSGRSAHVRFGAGGKR